MLTLSPLRAARFVVVAVLALTAVTGVALASTGGTSAGSAGATAPGARSSRVAAVQRALGVPVTGVLDARTKRAVRAFQRRKGLTPDGVIGPRTLAKLGLRRNALDRTSSGGGSGSGSVPAALQRIAQCESGGDPRAVSPDGQYRGKYQFDRQTWASLGGSGDPAAASESEQDRRAIALYNRRGTAPWPNCA